LGKRRRAVGSKKKRYNPGELVRQQDIWVLCTGTVASAQCMLIDVCGERGELLNKKKSMNSAKI
jgi:hypothetical protein